MTTGGLPLLVDLIGRRVLVAGAGAVAARKVAALLDAGAEVHLVAPDAEASLQALAEAGRLTWSRRPVDPADVDAAWLVVAATDVTAVNAQVAAAAADRAVFCIRADAHGSARAVDGDRTAEPSPADQVDGSPPVGRPRDDAPGTASSMAPIRRGSVLVATSTGGAAPALAAALRRHLDDAVGPEWAVLADILGDLRDDPRVHRAMADLSAEERALRWRSLTTPDTLAALRSDLPSAKDVALACLCSPSV